MAACRAGKSRLLCGATFFGRLRRQKSGRIVGIIWDRPTASVSMSHGIVRIAKFATTLPLDRPMACLSAPVVLGLRSAALPARSSRRAAAKPVAARAQQQRVSVQATTAAAVAGASAALGWSTLEGSWCWKATHAMLLPACPGAGRVLM